MWVGGKRPFYSEVCAPKIEKSLKLFWVKRFKAILGWAVGAIKSVEKEGSVASYILCPFKYKS